MAKGRSTLKLFLDSSVLCSAVYSPTGGSSKLFTINNSHLYVSRIVLHEVEKNVRLKLESYHLDRFIMLASKLTIIDCVLDEKLIKNAKKYIVEKDSVILAEFIGSSCDHLITLDKKDFIQDKVIKFVKPKKILTPKMFFKVT